MQMSSSGNVPTVRLMRGDLLTSRAQTLVNTVNCVGVMGKGVAFAFKRRYPEMFSDYVKRCDARKVRLGEPYLYRAPDHLIINFPTKDHWRAVSKLEDIERGLRYLRSHLNEWGITSLAVPPLGCGNGQLEWSVVGPTLYRHLSQFEIPVDLYVPHDMEPADAQLSLLDDGEVTPAGTLQEPRVEPGAVALVEILARLEQEPYHWPIGRIMFQKIAYFATVAGVPTGLEYEAATYGPYSGNLSRLIARLQNNGLVQEQRKGRMFETRVGRTFHDAKRGYSQQLCQWESQIERVVDLVARFDSRRAEVAGSVHYVSSVLRTRLGRAPAAAEVIEAVEKWKIRRNPPIKRADIARSIVELATQRWVDVVPDHSVKEAVDELVGL
jgi:O-acetyl-ADP-ribose deacetylase (regulator of RNase III)